MVLVTCYTMAKYRLMQNILVNQMGWIISVLQHQRLNHAKLSSRSSWTSHSLRQRSFTFLSCGTMTRDLEQWSTCTFRGEFMDLDASPDHSWQVKTSLLSSVESGAWGLIADSAMPQWVLRSEAGVIPLVILLDKQLVLFWASEEKISPLSKTLRPNHFKANLSSSLYFFPPSFSFS